MRKKVLLMTVGALVLATITPVASAGVKPGTKCTKQGQTSTTAGIKYTCIKSGNKLVWNKGVTVKAAAKPAPNPVIKPVEPTPVATPSATPVPTATPIPTPSVAPVSFEITPAEKFKKLIDCQVGTRQTGQEQYGFPRPSLVIPTLGDRKSIALFVYFDDLPFEQRQFAEWRNNQIPTFEKYVQVMSYGKLKYKVDIFEKAIHIKKSVLAYNLDTAHDAPMKPNADTSGLVRDAVLAADAEIDFSNYEFINVVTPWTRLIGFEGTTGVNIKADGKQFNFASFGPIREYLDDPTKKIWLLHEVGHMMGLIHQFNVRADWGRNGFPIWSAMGSGVSPLPEFIAWEKFLLGWLSEDQVRCVGNFESSSYTTQLTSLSATDSGVKSMMIKLTGNQILVIESRRTSELGEILKGEEGVLAYIVDADIRGNDGAATLVFNSPKTRRLPNGGGALIGTLQKGESIVVQGIKLEVLGSDSLSDVVRVSKG